MSPKAWRAPHASQSMGHALSSTKQNSHKDLKIQFLHLILASCARNLLCEFLAKTENLKIRKCKWMPNGLNPALDESLRSFLRLSYSILLVSKIFQLGTANKFERTPSEKPPNTHRIQNNTKHSENGEIHLFEGWKLTRARVSFIGLLGGRAIYFIDLRKWCNPRFSRYHNVYF